MSMVPAQGRGFEPLWPEHSKQVVAAKSAATTSSQTSFPYLHINALTQRLISPSAQPRRVEALRSSLASLGAVLASLPVFDDVHADEPVAQRRICCRR